ncbi:hypothetical protein A2761_02045 [Candidatus Kaiserbacteria bacterium RIFCSPHIGHO2_01_FULL_51_33]|uniref:RNA helicase n=1 Tax=Candidatus Kaiserbacteria bacterium RIFCSPLOWO2_01_FULL_51_21 TaxID=1798508 RepID=A0A1F6ECX7_9BACT|nr:MAG: hypothetical protein A2761_02045 [Candidatus Kaiserbacteria bacterium RIFCSPHIGHO2_01_FULL_51_33]OGG71508.1 MAG: hypothetical protein A3A35_02120 [Candidatus Kaiserbacteria bacterium RIFCSPLOWO2_01_FULL_51_21]
MYSGSSHNRGFSHSRARSKPYHRGGGNPRFGGGFPRGGTPRRGGRGPGENIHISKFINKAVVTEEIEYVAPTHQFIDFAIDQSLKRSIAAKGYEVPTPIQDRAIPHILEGRDLLGVANTGTGKTGAFLIPLINKVLLDPRERVLIIVPTRELAIQIDAELRGFAAGMRIFSVCAVGGAPIGRQVADLKRQYNFIIGTPGRLKDLLERRLYQLSNFNSVVLDEADRMLDMGFLNDMRFVMRGLPAKRQTLFFSATVSPEIDKLINEFLRNPVRISVKTGDTAKNVEQDVVKVKNGSSKLEVLHGLLAQEGFSKVLIFGRTKHGVENLSKSLRQKGVAAESIHGNKNHSQRQRALGNFKDNRARVLVATDVAARGLDIPDVSHVINYDIPATYDDYVHRIGRTGRIGKRGKALTFIE